MQEDHEHTGQPEPVELDPIDLANLERAPLSPAAREELRRRMSAGEDVYVYQSGARPDGNWNVWLTEHPGRVRLEVWEAVIAYWQAREEARREANNETLISRYGLQGPPPQREAAARLGAVAVQYGESQQHASEIVLYAYREADGYLEAHPSALPDDWDLEDES